MRSRTETIQLPFREPFDWSSLVEFLALRATPGVEGVDADSYRRTVSLGGAHGTLEVRPLAHRPLLELRVDLPEPAGVVEVAGRVRHLFDLDTDPRAVSGYLRRDPRLASLVDRYPGLRVPGAWDGFELAVRAILGQQVSVKAATTLAGRLAAACGKKFRCADSGELSVLFPSAEMLSKVGPSELTGLGLPRSRARAILGLAHSVRRGEVAFERTMELGAFVRQVTRVPGIGEWTAQYVAMRALGQPDAFPVTDLGLLKGASSGPRALHPSKLLRRAEKWRPFRAYAAMYLWKRYGAQTVSQRGRNDEDALGAPPRQVKLERHRSARS